MGMGELFHTYEESCTGGCNIDFNQTYNINCADAKNVYARSSSNNDDDDDKLSTGALVAIIVVVVVVAVIALFSALYFFYLKPKVIETAQTGPVPMKNSSTANTSMPQAAV